MGNPTTENAEKMLKQEPGLGKDFLPSLFPHSINGKRGECQQEIPGPASGREVCYNEDKKRPLFFRGLARGLAGDRVPLPVSGPEGGIMNRIEKKETAADAAKLFKEEVIELVPGIPREELCDMVDDFIYYQTDDMSKEEAHVIVEATCILAPDQP
jgi:hypothetical protein